MAAADSRRRVRVLLPLPLAGAYDYAVADDLEVAPGDIVQVPLGSRPALGVVWEGEGASDLPSNGSDLVTRTIRSVAAGLQLELPSFALRGTNLVPIERGLGSSSAATVAGVVVASLLLELGWEGDRETVFDRFVRLEPSRSTPGNGLGLSLVRAVARRHAAEVRLADNHPGLRVRIEFPACSPAV